MGRPHWAIRLESCTRCFILSTRRAIARPIGRVDASDAMWQGLPVPPDRAGVDKLDDPTLSEARLMTDLKFGILLWNQAATWDEMLASAREVDRLGYEHLWTWDHLY